MKTLKSLIFAVLVGLMVTGSAMAEQTDLRFAEVSGVLQTYIDKQMEESLQQETLHFPETSYIAQEQVKTDPAS